MLPAGVYVAPAGLHRMPRSARAAVSNFTVGRHGYGEITFDVDEYSVTDTRGIGLGESCSVSVRVRPSRSPGTGVLGFRI